MATTDLDNREPAGRHHVARVKDTLVPAADRRRRTERRWLTGLFALPLLSASPSFAERWQLDAGVSSDLTFTNNAQLSAVTPVSDTILTVRPRFVIHGEGARLKITGSGAVNGVAYLNRTQDSQALPEVDLNATLIAIERALTLEGGVRVSQLFQNPFGLRADPGTTGNVITTTQVRFSPVVEIAPRPGLRFRLRSDNAKLLDDGSTSTAGQSTATGYFGHHTAVIEQDARPFGWRLEAERTDTQYENSATSNLIVDVARAGLSYQIADQFTLGLRSGYERNNFVIGDETSVVYGIDAIWRPTERTNLTAVGEHRFFGTSGRLNFEHRMPWLAWNVLVKRDIVTTPQALFELSPTNNVAGLLDALFTTRIPDPIDRSRQVQDFIANGGLPASLSQATTIYSQRVSLETLASVGVTFVGVRNSVALTGFRSRLQDVPGTGLLASGIALNNNLQHGLSMTASRKLTALATVSATAEWSRIRALETATSSPSTVQRGLSLTTNLRISPKTNAYFGARYRLFIQNAQVRNSEEAAFAGLDHRF